MSTSASNTTTQTSRTVAQSVYANETPEGVGAIVRRSIGTAKLRNLSPFLMLDHGRISRGAGFPDHPHRGMTTVTYLLKGQSEHEDFMGNRGLLSPGDVQWMTAGRGVMHSEMPYWDPSDPAAPDPEILQLWVDLPAKDKMIEPSYQEKKAREIDTIHPADGVEITVISGESHGTKGFVRPVGGCWYFDVKLQKPGAQIWQDLPEGWTGFLYIVNGDLQIGDHFSTKHHTLVLSASTGQNGVLLTRPEGSTSEETRLILVAGEPLDQPVFQYGPFVTSSQRDVMQAIQDFRTGSNGFERAPGWRSEIGKVMTGA